jgi:glycosyltransferase involved in cell wall biosynthesis
MNNPLHIAYIDHTGELGGAEHLLLTLFRSLSVVDITPILVCGQEGRLVMEVRKLGIQAEVVTLPKFYSTSWVWGNRKVINPFAVLWNGVGLFVAAWRLIPRMKNLHLDIIQTNTLFSHIYGGMVARALKIPCVWYFHDLIEPSRLAGLITFIWRILASVLPKRIVADSRAVLIPLSSNLKGRVIYPCAPDMKDKESKNLVPLYQRLSVLERSILVGTLGRITYVKGLDTLIEAARLVISKNRDVHFVIFGGALFGEENYKLKLEKKVEDSGLTKNWHWMGYDELAKEYLRELDFVVFPSRREAFGLTLVEAGDSGKAAIGTMVGGIPEIIENGKTGILVPSENHQALAEAILELVNNPEFAVSLGIQARLRVEKLFNEKRYLAEFLELYKNLNN